MSGRATSEIVASLRGFIDYYGCDPGVPMSAVDEASEAADHLAELDTKAREAIIFTERYRSDLAAIDALRPPCPTCGGTGVVNKDYWSQDADDCPDCVDGKVSVERLVATWAAVWDDWSWANVLIGPSGANAVNGCRDHLRSVKP